MMKRTMIMAAFALVAYTTSAQAPERTVEAFGNAMKDWCKTGDIDYRIRGKTLSTGL